MPVLAPDPAVPWQRDGVAEPALVRGRDARYYLFFTAGLGDAQTRNVGLAIGESAFDPWRLSSQPVLRAR